MEDKDLYWLAGLIEGEGCFSLCGSPKYKKIVTVAVGMTDRDVMSRVGRLLGRKLYHCQPRELTKLGNRCKMQYRVHVYGKAAVELIRLLYPLMGLRRRKRMREVCVLAGFAPPSLG